MVGWLWKLNRWYDDLSYRDMGTTRFLIFVALIVSGLMLLPWGLAFFGGVSQLTVGWVTLLVLTGLFVPRVIWIEKPLLREKYPSKF